MIVTPGTKQKTYPTQITHSSSRNTVFTIFFFYKQIQHTTFFYLFINNNL